MKNFLFKFSYTIIFVFVVGLVGLFSAHNLIDYYVNDKVNYNEWKADLGNKFETDVATTFFEKFQFVNINGAFRRLLGQQEMNGVVKLDNGYLLTTIDYVEDDTLQSYAAKVESLNIYLRERGTELVYAMTPYTSSKYDPQLPEGVEDYGNYNADRLLSMLSKSGIDVIDYREQMFNDGINQYDMMYKTDHHWTTKAGLYAYGTLEDYIINKTNCDVDRRIRDVSNYTIKTYKNWHLGSRGQRTGRYFAGVDDFDLIIPNFESTIRNGAGNEGLMQDLVINAGALYSREYTSRYTYDNVYGRALGWFSNLSCRNDVKILLVSDSFAKCVAPYLMMGFSNIAFVYDGDVSSITPEFIDSYNPDVVILLYYLENAMDEGGYNFTGFTY